MKNVFIFSEGDLIKSSACLVLGAIFFGIPGLLVMLMLQWITRQSYAEDVQDKHGISHISASRLGGAAVFGCTLALIFSALITEVTLLNRGAYGIYWTGWIGALACAVLGLVEDIRNNYLTPFFRLAVMMLIFGMIVGVSPFLVPVELNVVWLRYLLGVPFIGWFLTVIFCVGFINAVNMADGANGLLPGILTISFSIFYLETNGFVYATLMTSCGLFTIFNVISGRLILGDAGAYGLGAALVLSGLFLFSEGVFSASFLAVLLAYPCIDILVSLVRRSTKGKSVFLPDDNHLHNRLNYHFRRWFRSKTLANSITGAFIVFLTSGIALLGYMGRWWPITEDQWVFIFIGQIFAYWIAFFVSGQDRASVTPCQG